MVYCIQCFKENHARDNRVSFYKVLHCMRQYLTDVCHPKPSGNILTSSKNYCPPYQNKLWPRKFIYKILYRRLRALPSVFIGRMRTWTKVYCLQQWTQNCRHWKHVIRQCILNVINNIPCRSLRARFVCKIPLLSRVLGR